MTAADANLGSLTRCERIEDHDIRRLCGRPTLPPRLSDIAIRSPQPQPDEPLSIHEIRIGLKIRAFAIIPARKDPNT